MDVCKECDLEVTDNQEAVQCDGCDLWQHRECGTEISRVEYRATVREGQLHWSCTDCREDIGIHNVYAVEMGDFDEPEHHEEVDLDLLYPMPEPVAAEVEVEPEFRLIPATTRREKFKYKLRKFFDSDGYQYTKKIDKRRINVNWRCSVRSKAFTCKASVIERDGEYTKGLHHHITTHVGQLQAVHR